MNVNSGFISRVRDYIESNHLVAASDKIVVGLSGGADSVALLSVLIGMGCECRATHCNFHLRGEESDRDERFCRDLCRKLGIDLTVKNFDVEKSRASSGESIEMACRRLRYDWWASLLASGHGTLIAVGHHKDDNIETFFLNLLRGSGISGLKGMLPRSGKIIRPFLNVSHQEILEYLKEENLDFVTDSTNLSNQFKRNRLRNEILPLIEQAFPGASDSIATSISNLRDNFTLYSDHVSELRQKYIKSDGSIDLGLLTASEKNARMVLYEILAPSGINMTQIRNILDAAEGKDGSCTVSGKIFHAPMISYLLNRGILMPISPAPVAESGEMKLETLDTPPFKIRRLTPSDFFNLRDAHRLAKDAIYLDSSILDGSPEFVVRTWRKGDRFRPFGMKGSKLVSDLLSDAKLSLDDKRHIKVLTRNGEILWVIGLRASNAFVAGSHTNEVLEVRFSTYSDSIS